MFGCSTLSVCLHVCVPQAGGEPLLWAGVVQCSSWMLVPAECWAELRVIVIAQHHGACASTENQEQQAICTEDKNESLGV